MARKLRVLAFHSFRTSAKIFQQQVRSCWRGSSLRKRASVIPIDAHFNFVYVQMSRVGLDKDLEDLLDVRRGLSGAGGGA